MDEDAELAQLQARAYGPDADIDAAGAARLRELQERARAARSAALATAPTEAPVTVAPVAAPAPPSEPEPSSPGAPARPEPAGDARPAAAEVEAPARGWWRRPAVIAAVGALAGVALAGGVGAAITAGAAPDAILAIEPEGRAATVFGGFGDATVFELYHGIDVSSTTQAGSTCLHVYYDFVDEGGGTAAFGDSRCAPDGAAVIAEVWVGESPYGWSSGELEDVRSGTFLRFQLDGDVVKVWRFDPPAPTETPAGS
ncbi:hypothetical protein [Microbacterium sediminis]|uniref:Uncharacterized protein n=1 Tax=Microbacterium sediminis TaxID=904291 RepID=A0A1B9NCQ0_9MICO|nr:hypothetical protein [Microbacterium sediminis]OCG74376.1 hypothetical protein A7J15_05975 [Microbacterium sediminis]QBR73745.1 hypothetical protein E3O41_04460 [Microbacterium sediminis]